MYENAKKSSENRSSMYGTKIKKWGISRDFKTNIFKDKIKPLKFLFVICKSI